MRHYGYVSGREREGERERGLVTLHLMDSVAHQRPVWFTGG